MARQKKVIGKFVNDVLEKANGDWQIRLNGGWRTDTVTGEKKRWQPTETLARALYPDRDDAENERRKRQNQLFPKIAKGKLIVQTFEEYARNWVENTFIKDKGGEVSTQTTYRSHINRYLIPTFGEFRPQEITSKMVKDWLSQMKQRTQVAVWEKSSGKKLSPGYIVDIVHTFMSIWDSLVYEEQVSADPDRSPFLNLDLPEDDGPVHNHFFTWDEVLAIIDKAEGQDKVICWIAAETGFRRGEVLGLQIKDFDPVKLTLRVDHGFYHAKLKDEPKGEKRTIEISRDLANAIQQHLDRRKGPNPMNMIFTGDTGNPLWPSAWHNGRFKKILNELGITAALKANGVYRCGLHAMRRFNGDEMQDWGMPDKTGAWRLGQTVADYKTERGNKNKSRDQKVLHEHYQKPNYRKSRMFADYMGARLRAENRIAVTQAADVDGGEIAEAAAAFARHYLGVKADPGDINEFMESFLAVAQAAGKTTTTVQ